MEKLAHGKKKVRTEKPGLYADAGGLSSDDPVPNFPTEQTVAQGTTEPAAVKMRESAHQSPSVEHHRTDLPKYELPQIKTKNACIQCQTDSMAHGSALKNDIQPEPQTPRALRHGRQRFIRERSRELSVREAPSHSVPEYMGADSKQNHQPPQLLERGQQKFVWERARNISVRQMDGQGSPDQISATPTQRFPDRRVPDRSITTISHAPVTASETDQQPPMPMEQGRRRFVRERQKKAAVQRMENSRGPERAASVRQLDTGDAQRRRASTLPAQAGKRPASSETRGTVSNSKHRIKEVRSEAKAVGRTSRQAVKGAESSGKVIKVGERSAQTVRQTVRAAVQARQRAVQATDAARRTTATAGKAMAKAAAAALREAVSAIRSLAPLLAAGGGAVTAVVLVLCLVGALVMSPLGIFFFGGDSGGQQQTVTVSAVVRELNQEYDARLEEIKAGVAYDEVRLSGSRAPWVEMLAVYAVKTTSDPTNGQEVVTMTDGKKAQLKQVFWDMNQISSFTSTVPGEGEDEEDTTTLHITVTAKTADEMADIYGFNIDQRQQLAELLSDEYRELWNVVLYGIGTGSGEIVAVALSQVGNIGGQPYWSWYGFDSHVNWCACFVSWCANECSYIDAGVIPKFSGCVQGSNWFKNRGQWQDRNYTPNPGDIIFFDWDDPGGYSGPQDGVPDHVGIVEKVENGRVYTIEGNSGDRCRQQSYPLGYYEIYGYGLLCLD